MLMDDIGHKSQARPTRFLGQLRVHVRQQGLAHKTAQGIRGTVTLTTFSV